ncbi:MAG TPA: hypothetical protein VF748_14975 [Candidatus Acidoferrum sp.]
MGDVVAFRRFYEPSPVQPMGNGAREAIIDLGYKPFVADFGAAVFLERLWGMGFKVGPLTGGE